MISGLDLIDTRSELAQVEGRFIRTLVYAILMVVTGLALLYNLLGCLALDPEK